MDYKQALKFYPNFPIEGVNFVDIIPLMQDKHLFKSLISDLGALCSSCNIAAPEARGFLFAAPMLTCCDNIHNVIPMRKKGKLPHAEGDLVGVDIVKEYGKDQIYFRLSDVAAGVLSGSESVPGARSHPPPSWQRQYQCRPDPAPRYPWSKECLRSG